MKSPISFLTKATLILLLSLALVGCGRSVLYSDLNEQQANQVMAALMAAQISASKEPSENKNSKGAWQVKIADSDFSLAMQVLENRGLPRRESQTLGDLFKNDKIAQSAMDQKALYKFGIEESMRRKLMKIDGVVDADVTIALPDRNPLGEETGESSASVFIYQAPGVNLRDRETDLKLGIKDGIEGLKDISKVTIKFFTVGDAAAASAQAATISPAKKTLAAIDPLSIILAIVAIAVIALGAAGFARYRKHKEATSADPSTTTRIWNG